MEDKREKGNNKKWNNTTKKRRKVKEKNNDGRISFISLGCCRKKMTRNEKKGKRENRKIKKIEN